MPIDFPASPTTGQVYTYLGKSWVYNGTGWDAPRALSEVGAVQTFANAAARTAAIPSPTEGIVSYLNDVDALQVYSGSAWVSNYGMTLISHVPYTAATSVSLDNQFTSQFNNYKIILNHTATNGAGSYSIRFRTSSGDDSSALYNYYSGRRSSLNGESFNLFARTQTSAPIHAGNLGPGQLIVIDLSNPNLSTGTLWSGNFSDSSGNTGITGGAFTGSTVFSGISFLQSGTNQTGTISIYGIRK
jgi:hypothetical protein